MSRHETMMTRPFATLLVAFLASACAGGSGSSAGSDQAAIGTVLGGARPAAAPRAEPIPWESLFDGTTLSGWHGFRTPGRIPAGWKVVEGTITRVAAAGDLVTDRTYANFELELEWQIEESGNSGVLYRIDPTVDTPARSAPEYQLLDDAGHPDGGNPMTSSGAAFGVVPVGGLVPKPAGLWNTLRLVVNGDRVEHWYNGARILAYELGSTAWEGFWRSSRFSDVPAYGRTQRGFIGLRDEGTRIAFRNLRIRELP
ncbi:MAG TPA: DUF1080 domain-containing protein [Gemmatimonas sp.]|nr:DUF1080 domain-containing protein [Gemmatimonas sp.]